MKEVLVTADLGPEERAYLEAAVEGRAVVRYREALASHEVEAAAGKTNVLLIWGRRMDFEGLPLEEMEALELVQAMLAGVETLPYGRLPPRAMVCSGAGALTSAVAEHALALLMAAAKHVVWHHQRMTRGEFPQGARPSKPLKGGNLVVVGVGEIGREVVRLGRALGMEVVGVTREGLPQEGCDEVLPVSRLREALSAADAVVLALPLTRATRGLVGPGELGAMKPDAVLVNVARGKVVDEKALYHHLRDHPEFTAALDVWWRYPEGKGYTSGEPFHRLENVIMTPHVGGDVPGFRGTMARNAIDNVGRFLRGEEVRGRVRREDYV